MGYRVEGSKGNQISKIKMAIRRMPYGKLQSKNQKGKSGQL